MMMRLRPPFFGRVATRGFSLVELMVGIVIAMAAIIVVMQVFKLSEGQRRNTSGGDDAQTTGAVALSLLQRELRQAGQGFFAAQLLGCQLSLGSGHTLSTLAPIIINPTGVPAGDADTDVILIAYGSSWSSPEGNLISGQPTATSYTVTAAQSYTVADYVVAVPQTRAVTCTLDMTKPNIASTSTTVTVALGLPGAANGVLFNLGRTPRFVAYAVRSGRLTACDYMVQTCTSDAAANWTEVAEGVVSLRAEYARDTSTPRDATADGYDQSTSTLTTWCAWSRVVGVRLALVARSRQPEKADVAASAPTWAGAASTPIKLNASDWKRYRYKTFETVVPLRNVPGAAEAAFVSC